MDTRSEATVVIAFVDPLIDSSAPLSQLVEMLPGATIIGISTAGQILGGQVDPAPLVAAVAVFERARVVSAYVPATDSDSEEVGKALGAELSRAAGPGPISGVMVFGGGLGINGSALVSGLTSALPEGTALSGGLAGDGARFERSWVSWNGQTADDCVAAFAVLGDGVDFQHGSQGGWDGFGPKRTITRSSANVLYELDGQPALALYKQYLGDRARELPSSALLFPLTVTSPDGAKSLVRTILSVDETQQSMTFAGDVPQGWSARLMWTTTERLTEGAAEAAELSAQQDAALAVAISCVGRRLVLGTRTEEELEAAAEGVGRGIPLVGFYSYGEIAPLDGMCSLHNQTMTITTIRER